MELKKKEQDNMVQAMNSLFRIKNLEGLTLKGFK